MSPYCAECGDQFHPVEYRPAEIDPDEPDFCSNECETAFSYAEDLTSIYWESLRS